MSLLYTWKGTNHIFHIYNLTYVKFLNVGFLTSGHTLSQRSALAKPMVRANGGDDSEDSEPEPPQPPREGP